MAFNLEKQLNQLRISTAQLFPGKQNKLTGKEMPGFHSSSHALYITSQS